MAYDGTILVQADSGSCDLTSALECIMLGLEQGTSISIQVTGSDEETFGAKLIELFETIFDFPPQ